MANNKKPKPRTNAEEIPAGGWRSVPTADKTEEAFKQLLPSPTKLMFNHTFGQLEIKPPEEQGKNDVVVDQIYKDGFFARPNHPSFGCALPFPIRAKTIEIFTGIRI